MILLALSTHLISQDMENRQWLSLSIEKPLSKKTKLSFGTQYRADFSSNSRYEGRPLLGFSLSHKLGKMWRVKGESRYTHLPEQNGEWRWGVEARSELDWNKFTFKANYIYQLELIQSDKSKAQQLRLNPQCDYTINKKIEFYVELEPMWRKVEGRDWKWDRVRWGHGWKLRMTKNHYIHPRIMYQTDFKRDRSIDRVLLIYSLGYEWEWD